MQPALSRLRPLSLGDILDTVFRLYRQNFLTFIGIVALLQVPLVALQTILMLTFGQNMMLDMMQLTEELPRFDPQFDSFADLPIGNLVALFGLLMLVGLLQGIIVQPLINGAMAYAVSQSYLDRPISLVESYTFNVGRMITLIATGLLIAIVTALIYLIPMGLIGGAIFMLSTAADAVSGDNAGLAALLIFVMMMAGILALLVISLVLAVFFLFVPQVVILEGCNPFQALARSWQLARGSFWRILGLILLLTLLIYFISAVPSGMLGGVIGIIFDDPIEDFAIRQSLSTLIGYIAQILVLPVQLITFTVLYYDLRVRKEGYDLELMTQDYVQQP